MASRFHVLALAGVLLGSAGVPAVHADAIVVTFGKATVAWDDPPFLDLSGPGFHLISGFFSVPSSPQDACFDGCSPGARVDLTTRMGGAPTFRLGQAQLAVVNGVTYAGQGQPESWLSLSGEFLFEAGDVIVPPLTSGGDELALFLTTPFLFSGTVAGFRDGPASLFDIDLAGSGTATLRLINAGDRWRFPEVYFSFEDHAPVPEPASIVLLGGGLAGLLLRLRRRAGSAHDRLP